MSRALVEREEYPNQDKPDAFNLMAVDGNPLPDGYGKWTKKRNHHEEMTVDIVGMATQGIVFGMP